MQTTSTLQNKRKLSFFRFFYILFFTTKNLKSFNFFGVINLIFILFFLFICFSPPVQAQEILTQFKNAVLTGKSQEIIDCFNDTSEIFLEGKKTMKKDSLSSQYFRDFFKKNSPQSFNYIFKSILRDNKKYAIGNFQSTGGNFRVLVRILQDDDRRNSDEIYYLDISKKEE